MSQERQTTEEPGVFDEIKGLARDGFNHVNRGVDDAMRVAHSTARTLKDGYKIVEDTVGRDRLWGAGFGAKAGGVFMATKPHPFIPAYVTQIGVGTIIGAAVGFAVGPYLAQRYKRVNGTDTVNDNDEKPGAPKNPSP